MSKQKYSLWLHYSLSAAIVLIALLAATFYATDRFKDFFIQHLQGTLESRAIAVNQAMNDSGAGDNSCHALQLSDPLIRVTIIDARGVVLCDSKAEPETMENHALRPEIKKALAGRRGSITRFSETLQASMLYVAIPRYESQQVVRVIRTAMPLVSINNLLDELYQQSLILLILMLVIVSLVTINIYRKISRPLTEITDKAIHFAHGDFDATIANYDIKEIDALGHALNRMAKQLSRLENLRQDFVANVSHELKTPIATIKGYVETLLDGEQHAPDDQEHFLKIVLKQNDRLAAIVDDLLTLSRLESAPVTEILELSEQDACELLRSSVDICQARAYAKGIRINIRCAPPISIRVDDSLMTQALVNLLDNAIKYSPHNTGITLSAENKENAVQLRVCDQGPGIPEEHIPRLFERFYRVDKSRSRRIGGTGLGLAIVKHISSVHEGRVDVVNNRGAGCCFIISLH